MRVKKFVCVSNRVYSVFEKYVSLVSVFMHAIRRFGIFPMVSVGDMMDVTTQ